MTFTTSQARASPLRLFSMLETLKKKGIEVLYAVDPIDEFAVQQFKGFDWKKSKSVTEEGLITGENIAAGPLLHPSRH
jgi:HSP90 family molecular chaperone